MRLFISILFFACTALTAQVDDGRIIVSRDTLANRNVLELEVIDGDTIPVIYFPEVNFVSRHFANDAEKRAYQKMKQRVLKVYPYARKATDLLAEIEYETEQIKKKRGRKKYLKQLEKQLNKQFKEDLVNLTTSEGKILVNLIERETGKNMYTLIKGFKNPISAFFYQKIGKRYGYDLKDGYDPERESDLESIISGLEANGELNKAFDIY